jgi:hypothetical protein
MVTNYPQISSTPSTVAGTKVVRKAALETVNNSTTLQDDNHLTFSIAASQVWAVHMVLGISGNSNADMKFTFTLPSGGSMMATGTVLTDGGATPTSRRGATPGTAIALNDFITGGHTVIIDALLVNSTTAGSATFQWAQNSAHASDLTIAANSFMVAHLLV